ncbi:hypothetical protein PVAND_007149 [Polypedilum vanderplanki]|uniref:RING-type domain-containing protein n=1 Tax=Polypedilum vanderplanki TaxID=319348 RepID=A0A9J6C5S9_POLVA|nr:hypothetical protein PVAND_007149 [Polypedilum vanderplanki]
MNIVCIIDAEILTKEDDIVVTPCGHVYHRECISEWISSSRTCPSCRTIISINSLIKIYFENDDTRANDLHNELMKTNEKLSKELKEFRDKANRQEAELIDLKIKHREITEKAKNFERVKQIDDMTLASLRSIKEDSTKEILKLSNQVTLLKLDLLAEKELRRIHQSTLHKLDPQNHNYDVKKVIIEENSELVNDSSILPPWMQFNSISSINQINTGTVPKDKNYVIPAKIQKANCSNENVTSSPKACSYNFNSKRAMKSSTFPPDGQAFSFGLNITTGNCNSLDIKENSHAQKSLPEAAITEKEQSSRFSFGLNNPSNFSSLFRFGSNSNAQEEASTSYSSDINQTSNSSFCLYREPRKSIMKSPRTSER